MTTRIRITNLGPSTVVVTPVVRSTADGPHINLEEIELAPGKSSPSRSMDSCLYVYDGKYFTVAEKAGT